MIIMKDAAQDIAAVNGALDRCRWERNRRLLLKSLMGTGAIVVVDILLQHAVQMPCTEDEQAIQAFLTHRANPAFGIGIGVGCSKRRMDHGHPGGLKDSVKGWRKRAIVVVNQEVDGRRLPLFQLPDL